MEVASRDLRPSTPSITIQRNRYGQAVVWPTDIHSVCAHRVFKQAEEYLVRWRWNGDSSYTPYSWHPIHELAGADGLQNSSYQSCLRYVQIYLESLQTGSRNASLNPIRKRKLQPDLDHTPRLSPFDRSRELSSASSETSFSTPDYDYETFNCELQVSDGAIRMVPTTRLSIVTADFPTEAMQQRSQNSRYNVAANKIRSQFIRGLESIQGKRVRMVNTRDTSTPSLSFQFVNDYLYRQGVAPPDPAAAEGCGTDQTKKGQLCRPNMGGNCGCEYTRSCECLEFALINKKQLNEEEAQVWQDVEQELQDITKGLPKRFPFSKESRLLTSYYLQERWPIYECNDNCACGPDCKTRVVQRGRTIGLEVFRTKNRGWGLRPTEPLRRGQFIDTYLGEVITRDEANRRADVGTKGKDSYLFPLDKFMSDDTHEYEIDGEFFGGPSRFINHSCDPNCVVYVVSRNKNNPYLYEIAFFAWRDIDAGEELTFNYRDHEGNEEERREGTDEDVEEDSIPCLCGAQNCRKWLWK